MTNSAYALMHDLITSDTGDYSFSEHWDMLELIDLYEIDFLAFIASHPLIYKKLRLSDFNRIKADLAVEIANRACGLIRKYHEELHHE